MTPSHEDPDVFDELDDKRLLESLRAAVEPSPLSGDRNEQLIEAALSRAIPLVRSHEPTHDVSSFAGDLDGQDTELAEALIAAYRPDHIDATLLDALVAKAIEPKQRAPVVSVARWRLRNQAATAFLVAAAAGIALALIRGGGPVAERAAVEPEALAVSRSVAPLFAETFSHATPTERIDRIYAVRSRELRHNRYTAWRVR